MNIPPLPIIVLISGNGSNLQAIIDAVQTHQLPTDIKAVISTRANAYGLQRAEAAHIPWHVLPYDPSTDHDQYDEELAKCMSAYSPEIIVLAGFMKILGPTLLARFKNKIINIHPSLLPRYPGLNTHQQVIADGSDEHGCSIHFVDENLDAGPIIAQAVVTVKKQDCVETLKQKVHKAEHFLYPTVLNWFAQKRISLIDHEVFIDQVKIPNSGLRFKLL